ncbi:MAG: MOSC domain-containing protein, partial [Candidatus Eisenbacteria bacterium]|nr:MOSC domain-containing protein [Candidatus Eisenbacteria bacterium]
MEPVHVIDSESMGDPSRHLVLADLRERYHRLTGAPTDRGRVVMLIRKVAGGVRELPESAELTCVQGVPGDAWGRHDEPDIEAQLAVMQEDVASLVANGQPLPLFGDNLILDLDLSRQNLPTGSRVRVGNALLEVTPKPHNGCSKFRARFGDAALRFVSDPELRPRNLRGIYLRVVEPGIVRVGDD